MSAVKASSMIREHNKNLLIHPPSPPSSSSSTESPGQMLGGCFDMDETSARPSSKLVMSSNEGRLRAAEGSGGGAGASAAGSRLSPVGQDVHQSGDGRKSRFDTSARVVSVCSSVEARLTGQGEYTCMFSQLNQDTSLLLWLAQVQLSFRFCHFSML